MLSTLRKAKAAQLEIEKAQREFEEAQKKEAQAIKLERQWAAVKRRVQQQKEEEEREAARLKQQQEEEEEAERTRVTPFAERVVEFDLADGGGRRMERGGADGEIIHVSHGNEGAVVQAKETQMKQTVELVKKEVESQLASVELDLQKVEFEDTREELETMKRELERMKREQEETIMRAATMVAVAREENDIGEEEDKLRS